MFDVCIFASSEDDKYLVYGGIGTYLGVLTRSIRQLYPFTQVYWIAKSPKSHDFYEEDQEGVKRIYLSEFGEEKNTSFFQNHPLLREEKAAKYSAFISRVEEKILTILQENEGKAIFLEVGEWEGQAHALFSLVHSANLLKVARLHTPLAVCFSQNHLKDTALNYVQMLNEYKQMRSAHFLSSCTNYMKQKVIHDVLGESHPLAKTIVALPNPIDVSAYRPDRYTRKESVAFLHTLRPFSIDEHTFNVFIIGSVETRKGVELAIQAIPQLSELIPNFRMCFFGHHAKDGEEWSNANTKLHPTQLYGMIPEQYHHHLVFFNYVSHEKLPLAIAAGDVFPILSLGDNFPGVVAEVALSSKAIVALERGGVREMLEDENGNCVALSIGNQLESAPQKLIFAIQTLFLNSA